MIVIVGIFTEQKNQAHDGGREYSLDPQPPVQ